MEIAAGIAATGHALALLKQLIDVDRELSKAELKARLAEVYTSLADAKMALADAQLALRSRDEEIAGLTAARDASPAVYLHHGFPFRLESGKVTAGPHCPNCYDRKALVLLGRGHTAVLDVCPRCKGEFRHTPMRSHAQAAIAKGEL
jgi:hypothetical protein